MSGSSSRTSSASARSSATSGPPSSRERKAARGQKRVPGGPIDEDARARCDEPAPERLVRGIAEFNARLFFEQHETLETLWRETREPVRDLYHGILQIGVGFHHWRSGNFHGAAVLLEEGIERLRPFAPGCQGIDVRSLIDDASTARRTLLELGAERMDEFDVASAPRIKQAD